MKKLNGILLKSSCERRSAAASESATAEVKQADHLRGMRSATQALSLRQLNGILLTLFIIVTVFLISCGSTSPSTATNQVHMNNADFVQSSITIKKGESVTLIADTFIAHTIANGTWTNDTPRLSKESGAPTIDNVSVAGNSSDSIGPFNNAGTFKLYCTVHPGMNLTVIVQ